DPELGRAGLDQALEVLRQVAELAHDAPELDLGDRGEGEHLEQPHLFLGPRAGADVQHAERPQDVALRGDERHARVGTHAETGHGTGLRRARTASTGLSVRLSCTCRSPPTCGGSSSGGGPSGLVAATGRAGIAGEPTVGPWRYSPHTITHRAEACESRGRS